MPLEYTTTSAPVDDQGVKLLVYSPAGYGKTVLSVTMPGETCVVSAESGLLSLQPANQVRLFGKVRDLPVIKIRNGSELGEAYQVLAGPSGKQFQSIAIDSLTEIAEVVLSNQLAVQKDPRKAYGEMQETMSKYIRLFRDLPGKHVYMSAKQDRVQDQTGAIQFGPMMPGKTMELNVAHFFDEVFALTLLDAKDARGNNYRALRCRPNPQFQAKDRSGALDELEEPNLAKIISKIQSSHV